MDENIISLQQVRYEIKQMLMSQTPVSFQICFVTANRSEKTGGEIIDLNNCLLLRNQRGRPFKQATNIKLIKSAIRDPKHHSNQSFNIIQRDTDRIYKVHINLTIGFQNKSVVPAHYE